MMKIEDLYQRLNRRIMNQDHDHDHSLKDEQSRPPKTDRSYQYHQKKRDEKGKQAFFSRVNLYLTAVNLRLLVKKERNVIPSLSLNADVDRGPNRTGIKIIHKLMHNNKNSRTLYLQFAID